MAPAGIARASLAQDTRHTLMASDLMHVAQKCAAFLGERHASKQRLEARRLNPFRRDALLATEEMYR
ncbi:hypothetical protein AU467_00705 [Mesorhizobium loti]|uniref:Uncharacterized protein n=1 Tax=Rhizobium loti TaxID=381 RepID=A0A117N4Y5_RHILI|nr:hypothetical protein AU467_00705 [Mesorhizobium loti]